MCSVPMSAQAVVALNFALCFVATYFHAVVERSRHNNIIFSGVFAVRIGRLSPTGCVFCCDMIMHRLMSR